MSLSSLPGWAKRLDECRAQFSEAGFNGLIDHHELTNILGERLARGELNSELRALLFPPSQTRGGNTLVENPHGFWSHVYRELLGREIEIPPVPKLKSKTRAAIARYRLMLVFIPTLTEDEYPEGFVKLEWEEYFGSSFKRRPLPGRWVLADTTPKPDCDAKDAYRDQLTNDFGLGTRFNVTFGDCVGAYLPMFGKLLGVARKQVRLMTVEEWNFIGNLFNWLREHRSMDLPDFGSTNSAECCYNGGRAGRRNVGIRSRGGLADRGEDYSSFVGDALGFRFLAVV